MWRKTVMAVALTALCAGCTTDNGRGSPHR